MKSTFFVGPLSGVRLWLALLAGSTCSGVCLGQVNRPSTDPARDPLGGGRALDAGLSTTLGRINTQTSNIQAMIRYNNAIVSGEATGGRSLRVPLGYQLNTETPSRTSQIDTFNRDAADWRVSVLAAQQAPSSSVRPASTAAFSSYLGAGMTVAPGSVLPRNPVDLAVRARTPRAVESRADGRSNQLIGYSIDRDGRASTVRASALRGLVTESIDKRAGSDRLDLAKNPQDDRGRVGPDGRPIRPGLRDAFNPASPASPGAMPQPSGPGTPGAPGRPGTATTQPTGEVGGPGSVGNGGLSQQGLLQIFRDSARATPGLSPSATTTPRPGAQPDPTKVQPLTDQEIDASLERLRARLRGESMPTGTVGIGQPPGMTTPAKVATPNGPSSGAMGAGGGAPGGQQPRVPKLEELPDFGGVQALEQMRVRVQELVPEGATREQAADGFIKLGQELLAAGRFVSAEQAFDQALLRQRENLFARAGRVHAQLGAGMFLSSGLELRRLLTDHPEMIPVRFDAALVMPVSRAGQIVETIREQWASNPGSPVSREGALQMAYLGYQFDEAAWLADGLAEMERLFTESPERELSLVLRRVWGGKRP
ncbi:MAG: hypothetical protein ACK5TP_01535 [bacterium]